MEKEKYSAGRYHVEVIHKSKWVEVQNLIHGWSFSSNIVLTNGRELVDGLEHSVNPELMVPIFFKKNEGASTQFHREINRLVHNYVCSVSTYADHSRNLISKNYANKAFKRTYENRVKETFHEDGLCKFVRDMRNYIAHRGLPDSQMTLTAKPIKDTPMNEDGSANATMSSRITYGKQRFLEWKGWTQPAKKFLDEADDDIALETLFKPHIAIMKRFHDTLVEDLETYHDKDYQEYEKIWAEYERLEALEKNATNTAKGS